MLITLRVAWLVAEAAAFDVMRAVQAVFKVAEPVSKKEKDIR